MLPQKIRLTIDKCWWCGKKVKEGERIICPDGVREEDGSDTILHPERLKIPKEWITTGKIKTIGTDEWEKLSEDKGFRPKVLYEVAALCLECYQKFGDCEECDQEKFTPLYYIERLPNGQYLKKKVCGACQELLENS
ncbi:MAG: hypothetical protein ACFE68_06620 [Candidatus Hodarchaeota archaeon]